MRNRRLSRRAIGAAVAVLLALVCAVWLLRSSPSDPGALYTLAVADAVTADAEELEPLVALTKDSPMTTWDERGRVLLLSWHRQPERYVSGEELTLTDGAV